MLPGADCFVFDHRVVRWNFQRGDGTILRKDYWPDGRLNHTYDGANQPTTYSSGDCSHVSFQTGSTAPLAAPPGDDY